MEEAEDASSSVGGAWARVDALVFAGGDPLPALLAARLPPADLVVAADSGAAHALALGCQVDHLVGDLDSAHPDDVARIRAEGGAVDRHPVDKDATDLELALEAVLAAGAHDVVVVGGHGGRLDHLLANALLLASPRLAALRIRALMGDSVITVVRRRARLEGHVGQWCTLLAVGGHAVGVHTDGLRYALAGETLEPGSTRGVSNVLARTTAEVSLETGTLLVIQSGEEAP